MLYVSLQIKLVWEWATHRIQLVFRFRDSGSNQGLGLRLLPGFEFRVFMSYCQFGTWTLASVLSRHSGISSRVQSVLIFGLPTLPSVMGTSLPSWGLGLWPDWLLNLKLVLGLSLWPLIWWNLFTGLRISVWQSLVLNLSLLLVLIIWGGFWFNLVELGIILQPGLGFSLWVSDYGQDLQSLSQGSAQNVPSNRAPMVRPLPWWVVSVLRVKINLLLGFRQRLRKIFGFFCP